VSNNLPVTNCILYFKMSKKMLGKATCFNLLKAVCMELYYDIIFK